MNSRSQQLKALDRLLTIMDELREHCPWDRKQTNETLRHLTIEETYELGQAILDDDSEEIRNELGDLLLHIFFYSKIGSENQEFDISALAGHNEKIAAIQIYLDDHRYYLVENRQSVGMDQNLPGHGVLILYCNDQIEECRCGESPVKLMDAKPNIGQHKGAAFDIGEDQQDTFRDKAFGIQIKLLKKID